VLDALWQRRRVNLGTLGNRFGGITADADISAESVHAAIRAAKQEDDDNDHRRLTKDKSVIARLPVSGDVVAYLAIRRLRSARCRSLSRAEASGREQAWHTWRYCVGCPAGSVRISPARVRSSGHGKAAISDSVRQLKWKEVMASAHAPDSVCAGYLGVEWHDRVTYESSFEAPPDEGTYDIPLSCLMSVDTPNLFAAGRTADGDRKAGASLRVMGNCVCDRASRWRRRGILRRRQARDVDEVRASLRKQGALIDAGEI